MTGLLLAVRLITRTTVWNPKRTELTTRMIHTSSSRNAVWFMAPIARLAVAISARLTRYWWKRLPAEQRDKFKASVWRRKAWLYGTVGVVCASGTGFFLTHLERTPITNRRRFVMYTRHDIEQLMDSESIGSLLVAGGADVLPDHDNRVQLIQSVVDRVITSNTDLCDQVNGVIWKVSVLDAPTVANAVSYPTGDIIVFTGMIHACHNQHELGLLISHEMAHVLLDHGSESLSHTGLLEIFGLFFIAITWLVIPSELSSYVIYKLFRGSKTLLVSNPYSRKLELEADQVGLMLAAKACYDPEEAIKLWTHLPMYNESDRVQEYLETHPCNERRLEQLTILLPQALDLYCSSGCGHNRAITRTHQGTDRADRAHQGTDRADRAHQGTNRADRAHQGTDRADRAHQGTDRADRAHQGTDRADRAHQGTDRADRAHQGTDRADRAHQGTDRADRAHQGTDRADRAHQGTDRADRAHQGTDRADRAHQGTDRADRAHQGTDKADRAYQGTDRADHAH